MNSCTRDHIREAAVWMTLLRGESRTTRLEEGFRRWVAEDPGHAAAFEKISVAWEETGALKPVPFSHPIRARRVGLRPRFVRAAGAAVAVIACLAVAALAYQHSAGISTAVGEQRMVSLEDGSRVYLNTDTRIRVRYEATRRAVELTAGEALFEVAPRSPSRPFVVVLGGRNITALGTSFVVRLDGAKSSVTLLEGKVAVSEGSSSFLVAASKPAKPPETATILVPGQRLTFDAQQIPRVDQPSLERVTAWRSGFVDLDGVPLAAAVVEMNRYSKAKIVVEEPSAAAIPITGIFRAGDSESFVHAVAQSYGLRVDAEADRLVIGSAFRKSN